MSSRRPSSRRPSGHPRGDSRSSAASAARRRAQQPQLTEEELAQREAERRAQRRRRAEEDVRKRAEKTRRAPRKPSSRAANQEKKTASRSGADSRGRSTASAPKDPRFTRQWNLVYGTGDSARELPVRLLVILAFAAIALLIVATPLTQYMAQQEEKRTMLAQLDDSKERVKTLEQELARWEDEEFVQSQARERLGYVMPGQTLYLVPDPDEGTAQEQLDQRVEEVNRERRANTPFYVTMMDSIAIAGVVGSENPSDVPIIEDPNEPVTGGPAPTPDATPSTTPAEEESAQ